MTKQELRELALDAYTTPGVTITRIPPKNAKAQIMAKARAKRQEEFLASRLGKEVA